MTFRYILRDTSVIIMRNGSKTVIINFSRTLCVCVCVYGGGGEVGGGDNWKVPSSRYFGESCYNKI
jgi:hypothetical protein